MKRFQFANQHTQLLEKFHLPMNSIYGRFNLPLSIAGYNTIGFSDLIYYIDDLTLYKHSISTNRGKVTFPYYHVHIYNAQKDRFIHITKQHKELVPFYKFIRSTLEKAEQKGNVKPIQPLQDFRYSGVPVRKTTPIYSDVTQNPYKPVYGYVFRDFRTPTNYAEDFKSSVNQNICTPISDSKYHNIERNHGQGVNDAYTKKVYSVHGNVTSRHDSYKTNIQTRAMIKPDTEEVITTKMTLALNEILGLGENTK